MIFRIAFFCQNDDDGVSTMLSLRKSDRRAIPSLLRLLRIEDDDDGDDDEDGLDILDDYMMDPKQKYAST